MCRGDYNFTCDSFLATGETEILAAQNSLQLRVQHLQSDVKGYGSQNSLQLRVQHLQSDVKGYGSQIQSLSLKLNEQDQDISAIKEEVKQLLSELSETRIALTNIAEKLQLDF